VDRALTIAEVTRAARGAIEASLPAAWVKGEVQELKTYQSGHWYFTLRDSTAQVRCVMWRQHAVRAGKPPAPGTEVFVHAKPTVWEERGEFRLTVSELLATDGVGLAALEFERVRKRLEGDGLLDPARKRPLPAFARRIAVVTSLDGAALRDVITVTRRRWPSTELLVIGARVQGAEAPAELARALALVNRLAGVDACIVGRGGGSREDLAAFNDEAVCRALAAVRVPTVSAVGHETDVSLTDLVADVRAATPSAAAELLVPDGRALAQRAGQLAARMAGALTSRTRLARERLARDADRLEAGLERRLESWRRRLEPAAERLPVVLRRRLDAWHAQAARLAASLEALSPLRVLERGYAIPRGSDGRVLRSTGQFIPGAPFRLRVADGEVAARTEATDR
jgi:exodeoxyribonuclease VII large subunit